MLTFLCNALLWILTVLLVISVFFLYVMIEVLKYEEAHHGTNLPEGLPQER